MPMLTNGMGRGYAGDFCAPGPIIRPSETICMANKTGVAFF
jgi:hypothetical protein